MTKTADASFECNGFADFNSPGDFDLGFGLAKPREAHKENEGMATRCEYILAMSVTKIHENHLRSSL